ncbi:hypothetical protein DL767_001039 [Monosporascus sp. MG133]|nr:hypothetical protein DL767_001039 [Monosporascus sp. MG133]
MSSPPSSPEPDSPGSSSNKENQHSNLVMRDKGKAPEGASKRKRALTSGPTPSSSRRRTHEPEIQIDDDESNQYDPDQSLEEKRHVQQGLRNLLRDLTENNDEYLQPDSTGLHETLRKANELSAGIKQTTEATIDSRLLVNTVDASYRKTVRLTSGNVAQGVDVDEFVSKCITYMRLGAGIVEDDAPELTSTQQQRRRPDRGAVGEDHEDEIGDEGDMFNWEHLGRFACLPNIRRPATSGFLLGPLSVEKKVRKAVKRSAPFRPGNLTETRPQILNAEDVQRSENNDLTAICSKILQRLEQACGEAQDKVEAAVDRGASDEEQARLMSKYGLRSTGGMDLLKFVVNPRSFGQTVENMFYVSFLIRDGRIQIEFDDNDLPSLQPVSQEGNTGGGKHSAQKQQAVLSIDMQTWRDIIDAFDITESIIEHRKEQSHQGPGARDDALSGGNMAGMGEDTKTETEIAEREERRQDVLKRNQAFIETAIQELDLTKDRIDASDDAQFKEWLTRKFKGITERLARIENEKDDFKKDANDNADNAKRLKRQIADLKNRKGDLFDEVLGAMKEDHERDRKKWDENEEMLRVALQEKEKEAKAREDAFKAEKAELRREVKDQEKRAEKAEAAFSEREESIKELEKTKRELEKTKQEVDNINGQYDRLQGEKGAVERQLAEARAVGERATKVARDIEAENKNLEENNETLRTQLENLTREKNDLEKSSRDEISSFQEKIQEIERESAFFGSRRGSNDDRASTRAGGNELEGLEFSGNTSQPSQQSDEENEGSQGGRSEGGASRKSDGEATRRLEEQLREKNEELATVEATAAALEQQLEQLREMEGELARTKENVTILENQLKQLREKEGELAKAKDNNTAALENQARQLQEKEQELTNAKVGIASLEKQLEQLQAKEEELTQAKTKIAVLENQLQQLKEKDGELAKAKDGEIAGLKDQVRQLKRKDEELDRVKEDIAALKDELKEKNDELIKAQQNVASLEEEVRELKEEEEELDGVKEEIAALRGRLQELPGKEQELAKAQENVAALKDELKEKNEELIKAQQNVASLEDELRRLKEEQEELTKAQQNVHSLEGQLRQLKGKDKELGKAKSELAALQEQLRQLRESAAEGDKNTEQKDAEIAGLNLDIARLKQELEKCQKERDDLKEQVDALTKEVLGANNARESLENLQKDLESRRHDLESQVKANKEQDAAKQVEIDRLQGEVEKLQEEVDQLKESVDTERERANTNNTEVRTRRDEIAQLQTDLRQANEDVEKLQADLQEARERAASGAGNTDTGARGQDVAAAEAFFNAKMADFASQLDRLRESYEGDRDIQDLRDVVAASGARAEAMFPEMAQRLDGFVRSTRDHLNDMFHDVRGNGAQALRERLQEMRERLGRAEHFHDAYRAQLDGEDAGADAEQLQDRVQALTASAATLREQIQKLEELLQALEAKQREWPGVEDDSSRSFQNTLEQIELARQAEEIQVAGLQAGIRVLEDELASKAAQVPPSPPQDELLRLQGQLDQARSDFQAVQDEAGQFVGDFVARLTDLSTLAREQITGRLDDQIDEFQNENQNQPSAEATSGDRLKSRALAELLHDQRQWTQDVMEAVDAMRTRAADRQFAHQGTQTDLSGDAGGFRFGAGGETWYSRHNVRVGRCCEGDWFLRALNSLAFLFMIATVIAEIRQYNVWRNGNAVTRALYMAADDNTYCLRTPNYDWFFEWLTMLLGRR